MNDARSGALFLALKVFFGTDRGEQDGKRHRSGPPFSAYRGSTAGDSEEEMRRDGLELRSVGRVSVSDKSEEDRFMSDASSSVSCCTSRTSDSRSFRSTRSSTERSWDAMGEEEERMLAQMKLERIEEARALHTEKRENIVRGHGTY